MRGEQGQPAPRLPAAKRQRTAERGFALLIVLWSLALIAFLVTQLTAAGRTEARIAANLRGAAIAEAAADGAVYRTLFSLLNGATRGLLGAGLIRRDDIPNGSVEVEVRNEAGKVNVNTASPVLMAALLREVGAAPAAADALANAIAAWRAPALGGQDTVGVAEQYRAAGLDYAPPGAPFASLAEIGLVRGMTTDLLARLRPHVTLYTEGGIVAAAADPMVLRAMQQAIAADPQAVQLTPPGVVSAVAITASAHRTDGATFTRHAVVRIQPAPGGRPYQILVWEAGAS